MRAEAADGPADDLLARIPVLGVVFQLVGYLVVTIPVIAPIFVALAAPIALGALCGIMNERSGVVNIGIEGMMLISAFTAFLAAALVAQAMGPGNPLPIFGVTIPILDRRLSRRVATGMLVSALHAWLSISIRADQIISGTIINILAFGLTGYLNRLIVSPNPRLGAGIFQPLDLPDCLVDLPLVGWIFKGFLGQGPITISVLFLVSFLQICFSGRAGACGPGPSASIPRPRRRSESTSSGCATRTSSWAGSLRGWPAPTSRSSRADPSRTG